MIWEGLQYGAFGYTSQDAVWFTRPWTLPVCRSVDGTNYYPYTYPCFRPTLPVGNTGCKLEGAPA